MGGKLNIENQFGEVSFNNVLYPETGMPLVAGPDKDIITLSGAGAPVDGTTGDNIAAKGSIYINETNGDHYVQTGLKTSPVWSAVGSATNASIIAATLTAFSAGAGVVSASDSILTAIQKLAAINNGTFAPTTEAVTVAGALSTTKMVSTVANAAGSPYAATLAAPSSQDGQLKVIKAVAAMTNAVTLAMTNIAIGGGYTARGTTTLTFTNVGDSAVLMAVGAKWVYLGGSAVAS